MKPQNYLLAIDQGTTGSRAILYARTGAVKAQAYQEFRQYYSKSGWVEHDPDEIIHSVRQVIERALSQARISPRAIHAIGITNQRETVVLWDRKTGRSVRRAIVWQDRRSSDLCSELKKRGHEPWVRNKTGLLIDPYFSATKLTWLFQNDPTLKKGARRGSLRFGTIDSWLLHCLTGGVVHATDMTNASRTLLFNVRNCDWDDGLAHLFQVPVSVLPNVLPSGSSFGVTKGFRPLPDGIPICSVIGDQQAALFGQSCYAPGSGKNTYGTGCFLLVNLGKRFKLSKYGFVTTIACDQSGKPVYAMEASIFIAGAAIQWLRDGLRFVKKASETEVIARRQASHASDLVVIPAFTGLGAPYWRPDVRGAMFGITRDTSREMIIKATVESIAFQVGEVFDLIRTECGVRSRSLKVDGGASRNRYLMQFQADLLDVPVLCSSVSEVTAWGTAKLAGTVSRFWSSPSRVEDRIRYVRYVPRCSRQKRKALVTRWRNAIHQLIH